MQQLASELRAAIDGAVVRLRAFSEEEASRKPRGEEWSKKQILGHLIDSAANNHQRFVRLQSETALVLPGYQQNDWVNLQGYQERSWEDLVVLWAAYNAHLAHILSRMRPDALGNIWKFSEGDLTLEAIAVDYLRHLRHHLDQISAR